MAQSRKHKSKRVGIIEGARIINKGAGGGDLRPSKHTLENAATISRLRKDSLHLEKSDKKADAERAKRIRRITRKIKNGGSLEVRR